MKVNEVEYQIKIANQKAQSREHLRTLKNGYERDMQTLKKNSAERNLIKDKLYREDKANVVRGYESRIESSNNAGRIALNSSAKEKNQAITEIKERFEEERQMNKIKVKNELDNLIQSYEIKLQAKDREMEEFRTSVEKKAATRVSNARNDQAQNKEYYEKKIDAIKDDYEKHWEEL